jgi:hypothetical protein
MGAVAAGFSQISYEGRWFLSLSSLFYKEGKWKNLQHVEGGLVFSRSHWLRLWCLTPLSTIFQSVLLVEEIGIPGENYRPAASHWQTFSHNVVSSTRFWMAFDKVRLVSTNNKVLILFYSLFLFEKQSVPITIKVLNSSHGEMYSIQHYVKKFVSDWQRQESSSLVWYLTETGCHSPHNSESLSGTC